MVAREDVLALMSGADAVYLATVADGRPRVRALLNLRRADRYPGPSAFCRDAGFTCFVATSAASGKIRELRANPEVSFYYADPAQTHGVELRGRAEIETDPELKRSLWDESWRLFWSGPEDPDYVVVRLRPAEVTGWWAMEAGFQLSPEAL